MSRQRLNRCCFNVYRAIKDGGVMTQWFGVAAISELLE